MKLENYNDQQAILPKTGKHIVAQTDEETITVYQAFQEKIATYAVANQRFGGSHYSMTRMTWIKPNFMWMMYRAGWATKPGQEHILAIKLKKSGFEEILQQAVHSTFKEEKYGTHENWKTALTNSEVRLQWDPDHNPTGEKLERKAIQLGLRGDILQKFNNKWIVEIADISEFVRTQAVFATGDFIHLKVPFERVVDFDNQVDIVENIGLTLLK